MFPEERRMSSWEIITPVLISIEVVGASISDIYIGSLLCLGCEVSREKPSKICFKFEFNY